MDLSSSPIESIRHWATDRMRKRCFEFNEGSMEDKEHLGLKGASLCELSKLGLPVPPGFVISSETCVDFFKGSSDMPAHLMDSCQSSIKNLERKTGKIFGLHTSPKESMPLLLSIRSGAAVDMPSMMDSVLNVGINEEIAQKIADITGNPRFALDVHRRFLQQYGTVVLKVPKSCYADILSEAKAHDGVASDCDLSYPALQKVVDGFLKVADVPNDPMEQFRRTVEAIFCSWYSPRAVKYREVHNIDDVFGTAVVVQSMVFGNLNSESCTGRVFTRDPNTGADHIYGEFVCQAEGDDVSEGMEQQPKKIEDMNSCMPEVYRELLRTTSVIEQFFGDAQEIEFTVQSGDLFILETINARRSPEANVRIAVDMVRSLQLTEREAILRVDPKMMTYFMHPKIDPQQDTYEELVLGYGFPTTSGAVTGLAVFTETDVIRLTGEGKPVILIRNESSPDDISGINLASGVLTLHGGVTSAAPELARSMDKTAITGAASSGLELDLQNECVYNDSGNICIRKEEEITLDGATGRILKGDIAMIPTGAKAAFKTLLSWSDQYRKMSVFATVSSISDAFRAIELRPDGVGLCQTETMLQKSNCRDLMSTFLLSSSETLKTQSLQKLESIHTEDLQEVFEVFPSRVVSVRLFDASINEFFVPTAEGEAQRSYDTRETNPALGVRGCRRAIVDPDFLIMQIRAIMTAGINVMKNGKPVSLDVLVPMLTSEHELEMVIETINSATDKIFEEKGAKIEFRIGAIIETPRACLRANKIVKTEGLGLVVFGLDRLTELTCGLSKDDTKEMIATYNAQGIIHKDPFRALDKRGVGALLTAGVRLVRTTIGTMPIGVFGSQCGHRKAIDYFDKLNLDFIVSSINQIPSVKISCAQAYITAMKESKPMWFEDSREGFLEDFPAYPFLI